MNVKKKIIFIGLGAIIVIGIALVTVLLLRHFTVGQAIPSKQSQSQAENPGIMGGSPVELRDKGMQLAEQGDRNEALKYLTAAKKGFEEKGDSAAVSEIDMQIDQAQFIPQKNNNHEYGGLPTDPGYISQ